MQQLFTTTATTSNGHTLLLDEPIPYYSGKLRVSVEPIPEEHPDWATLEADLRARQTARGHVPPSKEEIDSFLATERASWDR